MDQSNDQLKQRAHARYIIRIPVKFTLQEKTIEGESRNLSIGGMFVETQETIQYNTKLTVSFSVPTHNEKISVEALVCWIEKNEDQTPVGVGLKFGALRAIEVWALNQLFAQKKE